MPRTILGMVVVLTVVSSALFGANLLDNPGFEEGAEGWSLVDGLMQVDTSTAHSGRASLKLSWDEPGKRRLAIHGIPCKPGKRYLLRAWLKSKDVKGAAKGIHFGVEWFSPESWLGGSYVQGIGWERDWTEVTFLSSVVPENATGAHFFSTIDYGGAGTAWIDDISITEVDAREVVSWAVPRGTVVGDGDSKPFEVALRDQALNVFGGDAKVTVSLCSPPWNVALNEQTVKLSPSVTVSFPTGDLNPGIYKIRVEVKNAAGQTVVEPETRSVAKRPPMECGTGPHSGILAPGSPYPTVDIRCHRGGEVTGEVVDSSGRHVAGFRPTRLAAGMDGRLTTSGAPKTGRYTIRLRLRSDGHPDSLVTLPFTVLSREESDRATLIGSDNLLIDRGKTWFPMFVYTHTAYDFKASRELPKHDPAITKYVLDRLEGTPLGVLDYAMPAGGLDDTVAFADECAKRGIRLALSVKDVYEGWTGLDARLKSFPGHSPEEIVRAVARKLRDHPAMAVYYTNDELSTMFSAKLRRTREILHEVDPFHPTLSVHYDRECIRELAPTYDIFGMELYPWPTGSLLPMADWSAESLSKMPRSAPYWGCLWHFKNDDQPDEKLRALAYLAIAKGARGLLFYASYELDQDRNSERRWESLRALSKEIDSRAPILVQPAAKSRCRTVTKGVLLRTMSGDRGDWLLAVNTGMWEVEAVIAVPRRYSTVTDEAESVGIRNGIVKLPFEPFGVRLLRLE